MIYRSTRSEEQCSDVQAVLRGPARDGGLYVSEEPFEKGFDVASCLKQRPLQMAESVISALLPGFENMGELVRQAYEGRFETEDVTPLRALGEDYVLELFRGPTAAFKDVALSMLPRLMTAARRQEGIKGETVILTATSGDTGKAALEGFRDVEGTRVIVFYPAGGVSPIQRRQMVTQRGDNVLVCAVRGNFDDCQSAVKKAFSGLGSSGALSGAGLSLSSANSINIGRLTPQAAYYFAAYARLMERGRIKLGDRVDFVVPTGNFGDILAGYYAKRMGLPVGRLVCASNANRVLTDFFETGVYDRRREFIKSSSPSMDILISSNLERLLFFASGGDTELTRRCMESLRDEGVYTLPESVMGEIRETFSAGCCTEAETAETIGRVWRERRYLCDPHTAVAAKVAADYKARSGGAAPLVILSTASPYKFPAAVLGAIGGDMAGDEFRQMETLQGLSGIPIPRGLAELSQLTERFGDEIDRQDMQRYIMRKLGVSV